MLARLSQGLKEGELTRAHYITTFWWLGFESGHRQRQYARQSMTRPDAIRYLAENMHMQWALDSPFFAGWCMGWQFELGKGDE